MIEEFRCQIEEILENFHYSCRIHNAFHFFWEISIHCVDLLYVGKIRTKCVIFKNQRV